MLKTMAQFPRRREYRLIGSIVSIILGLYCLYSLFWDFPGTPCLSPVTRDAGNTEPLSCLADAGALGA